MDFNHSEDRRMLADTLRRFLAERYSLDTRHRISASERGYSPEIWGELAALGVPAALLGEPLGGFGGSGFDLMVVFEALGRALVVEPFLGLAMVGRLLADGAGRADLASGLLDGTQIAAVALYEPGARYDLTNVTTRAERSATGGWTLSGGKAVVPQLESATRIVVSARVDTGLALFIVPRDADGVSIKGYPLVDGGRGGELVLQAVQLPADTRIACGDDALGTIEAAVAAGIVALGAEAVGILDVIKDSTLDYLRTRVQFGVPIGKFQALQHRMATVAIEIEQARSAVINAAAALDDDRLARERAVSAAKVTLGRVGTLVAEESIQLHGGIGMTWELPLPHFAKRLIMIGHQLGDEDHHLERYVRLGRG